MNNQIEQKILDSLQRMDSFRLKEAMDFIEFLSTKTRPLKRDKSHIDKLCGKYQDRFLSSEEYSKRKKEGK